MRFFSTTLKTIGSMAVASALSVSMAFAAPVIGGATVVNATADLGGLGLTASPLGNATVNGDGFFEFPITGGNLDGLAGEIEHEVSGVSLTDGTDVLDLENFTIDTVAQEILGDVTLNGGFVANAAIFSFDVNQLTSLNDLFDLSDPSLELLFTTTAASVLTSTFNAPDLAGQIFGLAATAPEVSDVPIPAAFGLFAAGAAGLGWASRRRKKALFS